MTFTHPHELLPWAAAQYGGRIATAVDGVPMTFLELAEASARAAAGLHRLGVRPGEVVTVFLDNRWEWLPAYHGALRAGAVVNPVNSMLTAEEIAFIVDDAASKVVITSPAAGARLRERDLPGLRHVVCVDDAPSDCLPFNELLASGAEPPPAPNPGPRDPCSISYTSGTTGHPKGAVQPQQALRWQWGCLATLHARTADDVLATSLPFAHVYGNVTVHSLLLVGGRSAFAARFDPKAMIAMLEEQRATVFEGVPTMYAMMLAEPQLAHADLSTLRLSTVGGQVMPQATAEAWIARTGVRWAEVWGMTELSGFVTTHPANMPRAAGSVGVAGPGHEVRIADPENPEVALPDGADGEMQVRGPIVMIEYLNRPEATAETILPSGFLRTGDIGRKDADGNLFVVDRLKDLIITAGFNVYPAEIERVVAKHPAVALCGVAGQADEIKGELAHAFVVLRPGVTATAEDILAHCRESLAPYKVPRHVSFVDDLPRTSTGKIMRRELRALLV